MGPVSLSPPLSTGANSQVGYKHPVMYHDRFTDHSHLKAMDVYQLICVASSCEGRGLTADKGSYQLSKELRFQNCRCKKENIFREFNSSKRKVQPSNI
jgi:hypothetical protein